MPEPNVRVLYVTAPSMEVAERIAQAVVRERLAACANIHARMATVYRWEGQLEQGEEVPLLLKTTASAVRALTERVVALHPYACPCVLALPIESGHPEFLRWIGEEVGGVDASPLSAAIDDGPCTDEGTSPT